MDIGYIIGLIDKINFEELQISEEVTNMLKNSVTNFLDQASVWITNFLTSMLSIVSSLTNIGVYTVVTILASYFICVDRIYILDQIEHHFPKDWVKKLTKNIKKITKLLGGYLKAEVILIGTVMLPWAVICGMHGDINLAMALVVLYIIITVVRQFLEPKVVSNQIGIHPIFTLIAMYTGYKAIGIFGMLIGPIVIIILKSIFETLIDKGIVKTIFDKK